MNEIKSLIPTSVNVDDPSNIINTYLNPKAQPIFTIDMLKTNDDKEFIYSTPPQQFVNMMI